MTDNTLTELDTKSASTSASSVNEVLFPLQLFNADKNGSNVKENEVEPIDNDPTYAQLLKMVDVLSCTVEDLSKKMMLMMEYKESVVSKAHPHRSRDSGARHSRISTKVNCSPRQRRKALPHPPSEAPPRAPDDVRILQSTVSPASSLVSQLHDSSWKAVDTIPSPISFRPSPSPLLKSSLSLGNTVKSSSGPKANMSMETGSEQDLETCASLALEIQQEIQACRSSLTTLLSPVVSQFLSFSTPMQGSPPLSSAQNPNFTACSGAQLSSDMNGTGTAVLGSSASLGKPIELPHARRSSRIRISGDHVPSVGAQALPRCQFSPEGQLSAVVSDEVLRQPFLNTQNDRSHTSIYDSGLTIDETNIVHDLAVDSISSTAELNPTYSGDLAHFLELLDSRLTLLERDWPHFLQLHLVQDESLSRLEHETSQALNSQSPTSMVQEYSQQIESTMPEVYSSLAISEPELEQVWDRQLRIDQDLRSLVSRLERLPVFGNQTCTSLHSLDCSVELLNQAQEEILEGSGPSIETSLLCTTTASIDAMNTTPHLGWATTSTAETQNLVREIEELRQRVLQWDVVHVPEWNAMYNELHEEILRLKYSDLTD
ncbi:hypothetical protein BGZ75_010266 [Mortierella antarctica]|nr:hypothetical protein BGZ75_010266 [Mortierella antarctica]